MEQFLGLVVFSFVSTVSPGPNNILLWAEGASFGLRRTMPHVLGTAVGIGLMALIVATASGALSAVIPEIATAMKVGGSVYLLYLAYQIARGGILKRPGVGNPMGFVGAVVFQALNPKGWIFAIGAISAFRPAELSVVAGSLLVAITMMVVVVPTALLWAGTGNALGGLASGPHARAVSLALAGLLVVSIALVWV